MEVYLIFALSRTIPGHIREFNDLLFKIWQNNNTEGTIRITSAFDSTEKEKGVLEINYTYVIPCLTGHR